MSRELERRQQLVKDVSTSWEYGQLVEELERGRGEDEPSRTRQNHLFSAAEAPGSPPGLASVLLTVLRCDTRTRGPWGDDVISSPVKERTKGGVSQRPSLRHEGGKGCAEDRPEGAGGAGAPGREPHPGSGAASSPRLCPAGGRTRARARSRDGAPGGWAEAQRRSDPASPELAARGRLSPSPAPPVPAPVAAPSRDRPSLGRARPKLQRAPPPHRLESARRGRDAKRADCPTCLATNSRNQVLPKMLSKSAERQDAASCAMAPQRRRGGSPRRDPFLEAVATSQAGSALRPADGLPGTRICMEYQKTPIITGSSSHPSPSLARADALARSPFTRDWHQETPFGTLSQSYESIVPLKHYNTSF
ncbi:uncharacterized protein WM277_025432 [Molossus nigricans]